MTRGECGDPKCFLLLSTLLLLPASLNNAHITFEWETPRRVDTYSLRDTNRVLLLSGGVISCRYGCTPCVSFTNLSQLSELLESKMTVSIEIVNFNVFLIC